MKPYKMAYVGAAYQYYGTIFLTNLTTGSSIDNYRILIEPDSIIPEIILKPLGSTGISIKGEVVSTSLRLNIQNNVYIKSIASNGAVMNIPSLSTLVNQIVTPIYLLVSNSSGEVGSINIPANGLIGSNGTGTISSVSAGSGITIASSIISVYRPTVDYLSYTVTPSTNTPFVISFTDPTIDARTYIVDYVSTGGGAKIVISMGMTIGSSITMSILSGVINTGKTNSGSAMQNIRLLCLSGGITVDSFGINAISGGLNSGVTIFTSGSTVQFTLNLQTGDIWKAKVDIVRLS